MSDFDQIHALTIWNDRSQAGAVHYDGGMKLLIDRRVFTIDDGGIGEIMTFNFKEPLVLNFRVKFHKYGDLKQADA